MTDAAPTAAPFDLEETIALVDALVRVLDQEIQEIDGDPRTLAAISRDKTALLEAWTDAIQPLQDDPDAFRKLSLQDQGRFRAAAERYREALERNAREIGAARAAIDAVFDSVSQAIAGQPQPGAYSELGLKTSHRGRPHSLSVDGKY